MSSASENLTVSALTGNLDGWILKYISSYNNNYNFYVSFGGSVLYSSIGSEYRVQYSDSLYILGSSTNSFVGFLYRFQFINIYDAALAFAYNQNHCTDSQYLFNLNCYACNEFCMSTSLCMNNSCNLCFSKNCSSCTGYSFSECTSCSSGSLPDCSFGYKCTLGSLFRCNICFDGYLLNNGLCINTPSESVLNSQIIRPFIDTKFKYFSQFYSILQSGENDNTWSPMNNPESDDPIHYTMRGIYISYEKINYLRTKVEISLNYSFTLGFWIFHIRGGPYLYKEGLRLYESDRMLIKLRNAEEFVSYEL